MPQVFFNLESALAAAGSDLQHLVKMNVYVDSARTADEVRKLVGSRFHGPAHPAVSYVCTPLVHPRAQVALDAVAVVPGDGPTAVVRKRCENIIGEPWQSDVAILPRGDVVYVSGVAEKGDPATAAAKDLESLLATIGQMGLDRSQVVQVKAFIRSIGDGEVVKQQMVKAFPGEPIPPLVLVEWKSDLPAEIEMIVAAPAARSAPAADSVTYFNPSGVTPSPVFSRVVRVQGGKQIYIGGLYAEGSGDNQAQVRSVFAALEKIAKETGTDLRHLAKATYYITDNDGADVITKLRSEYYDPKRPPAASKAMVKSVGMSNRTITLDMIAVPAK